MPNRIVDNVGYFCSNKPLCENSTRRARGNIGERITEVIPELLATSTCPMQILDPTYTKMHTLCNKRAKIMADHMQWVYVPAARADLVVQHFKSLVRQHKHISVILLPCSTSDECFRLATVLKNAVQPNLQIDDVNSLLSLEDEVRSAGLSPLVDTDERREKPAKEKVQLVVNEARASTMSVVNNQTTSAAADTAKQSIAKTTLAADTMAWLLTQPVQQVETAVMDSIDKGDKQAAIVRLGRCRFPLYMQMLVNRDSLGSSEAAKHAKSLRKFRTDAFTFAITAESDDQNILVQTNTDARYELLNKFDTNFWNWHWDTMDPFALVYDIQKHRIGKRRATLLREPGECVYGDDSANRVAAEYMDRAFYFIGFDNGVFTNFMMHANKTLENAKGIPKDDFITVQRKVTAAVRRGLKEAATNMSAVMSTATHRTKFPHEGERLIEVKGSAYKKMLDEVDVQLTKMANDDFWEDRKQKEEHEAKAMKAQAEQIRQLGDCHVHVRGHNTCRWRCSLVMTTRMYKCRQCMHVKRQSTTTHTSNITTNVVR